MSSDKHRTRAEDGLSSHLLLQHHPVAAGKSPRPPAEDGDADVVHLLTVEKDAARPNAAACGEEGNYSGIPWLTVLGFVFLSFNSGMALYRSRGDVAAVSFVVFSYVDLVLLFYCLRRYERAAAGSAQREWLKAAVWILTAALTVVFSYKVAAIMPLAVAVLVWVMAFVTVAGGFYALFLHSEK